jgi:heme-degrading monooxygenase HmoA
LRQSSLRSGGRWLIGEPTKRVAIQVWDSLEKIQAWRNSAEYKKAREIGDKHAKFRAFAVEGLPQ